MKSFIKKQIGKIIPYILSVIILFLIGVIFKIQISILISTLSFITSIFTIILEKTWLEDYKNELNRELETHKAKLSGYTLVTKLQYDLEFKIYTEIYKELTKLFKAVKELNTVMSEGITSGFGKKASIYKEQLDYTCSEIDRHKPFYSEGIYSKINDMVSLILEVAGEFEEYIGKIQTDYDVKKCEEALASYEDEDKELVKLIRKRIENMKIVE